MGFSEGMEVGHYQWKQPTSTVCVRWYGSAANVKTGLATALTSGGHSCRAASIDPAELTVCSLEKMSKRRQLLEDEPVERCCSGQAGLETNWGVYLRWREAKGHRTLPPSLICWNPREETSKDCGFIHFTHVCSSYLCGMIWIFLCTDEHKCTVYLQGIHIRSSSLL